MRSLSVAILCTILMVTNGFNEFLNPKLANTFRETSRDSDTYYTINELRIEQRVDHFSLGDLRTFDQRTFYIDDYYQSGGPILIVLGGIGFTISNPANLTIEGTLIEELANRTNAVVFAIENRYFGESRPTDDLSTENLQYLTIEQSLADYAVAIAAIRNRYIPQIPEMLKVILIGTDTGASMATWMREKYPHLVDGVWSSSGPLQTKVDFDEYFTDIAATINMYGNETCYERIDGAFRQIEEIFENGDSASLTEIFNLSAPIVDSDPLEIVAFYSTLALILSYHVEYYNHHMLTSSCNVIMDYEIEDDLLAFAKFIQYAVFEQQLYVSYADSVELYSEISWDSLVGQGGNRAALYFRCSQFSLFYSTNGLDHPFGDNIPIDYYTQSCRDVFGEMFTDEFIAEKNDQVNIQFGGQSPEVEFVYFVNGGFDPYRLTGITQDLNEYAPADVIPLYGKSYDLLAIDEEDSDDLLAVKERVFSLVDRIMGL